MWTTQEKIVLYVGSKNGKDIAFKLQMTLQSPEYSNVIVTRQQEWDIIV